MKPGDRSAAAEVLRATPLFAGLAEEAYEEVLRRAVERTFTPDTAIFHEGEPAEAFYVVVAGRVKLIQTGAEGHEVLLRFLGPGQALAAVAALEDALYPVTAWTVSHTRVLLWSRPALRELLRQHPPLACNALALLSERLREMQERFRELATERVAQRVARTLVRLVRQAGRRVSGGVLIDLPLSRQDLAEMTGTTLFTVSRLLSEWESRGIVESGRERVVIRSPHALVAIAEDLPAHPEE